MKRTGMQLTAEGDLVISGDTIRIGDTLYQNQYMILKAQKGDFKEYPTLGAGIEDITNDEDVAEWKKRIREEFLKDDLHIKTISISGSEIYIDADY